MPVRHRRERQREALSLAARLAGGDSSIEMRLEAGTYTLEATTDGTNIVWKTNAGTFELRWRRTD